MLTLTLRRNIFAASIALCAIGQSQEAASASLQVQLACASDYYAYCSKHDPDGPGVRSCMRANGSKLSTRCVGALVAAGEVSRSDVQSRATTASK